MRLHPTVQAAHGVARRSRSVHQRGIMLVEVIVYGALFIVIAGFATAAFYRALEFSRSLRGNAQDIAQALQAGERWRSEVRGATGPVRLVEDGPARAFVIPRGGDQTVYIVQGPALLRSLGTNAPWVRVLYNVQNSTFNRQERGGVVSWRWELELATKTKQVKVRPLFTFQAVATADAKP